MNLIEARNLKKHFMLNKKIVRPVDDISFSIEKGKTLALVGESGCGKSTLGKAILNLLPHCSGELLFEGENIFLASNKRLATLRAKMQMIFQNPFASLNPRMTVQEIVAEPLHIHKMYEGEEKKRVEELLQLVGLPLSRRAAFPLEFSGGQRQRIGIARSLATSPQFIVCDEPVSSLDISIQAQIINLLKNLQKELTLTYLFISHDLAVVRYIADFIAVMYLGKFVEMSRADLFFKNPLHPYSRALISAVPTTNPIFEKTRKKELLEGEPSSFIANIRGCPFAPRCKEATTICKEFAPIYKEVCSNHFVSCHKF